MSDVLSVTPTSAHKQRLAIVRDADARQDEVLADAMERGFAIDWDDALSVAIEGDPYTPGRIAIRLATLFRADTFRDTIRTLAIHGAGIAIWSRQRYEGLAGVRLSTRVSAFAEPSYATPSKALAFWRDYLGIADAGELDALDTRSAGEKIADRITGELMDRLTTLHEETVTEGLALGEFIKRAREIAPDLSRHLLETEYRTHLATVYGDRLQAQIEARANVFPFMQFMIVNDNRTTWWICLPMGTAGPGGTGYIAATGDPIWSKWSTPCHFSCFVPETEVEGSFDLGTRMLYDGEVVELVTRRGYRVTVTPNHPIATAAGFKAAGLLLEGDDILCRDIDVEARLAMVHAEQKQNPPSRIDEVWRALGESGKLHRIARTTEYDFHGDAVGGDGYVDVVAVDGELLNVPDTETNQRRGDGIFEVTLPSTVAHAAGGGPNDRRLSALAAAHSRPCARALPPDRAAAGLHSGPFNFLGFGSTAQFDARCAQADRNGGRRDAEFFAELLQGDSGQVAPADFLVAKPQRHTSADLDTGATEPSEHRFGIDAVLGSDAELGHSRLVIADKITGINRKRYVGHVYDLRSATGLIIANGVIASNCRSQHSPIGYREAQRLGILAKDGKTRIAITGGNPRRPYGDPPTFAENPNGSGAVKKVEPQEGFGGRGGVVINLEPPPEPAPTPADDAATLVPTGSTYELGKELGLDLPPIPTVAIARVVIAAIEALGGGSGALVDIAQLRAYLRPVLSTKAAFDSALLGLMWTGFVQMQSSPTPSLIKTPEDYIPNTRDGGYFTAVGIIKRP